MPFFKTDGHVFFNNSLSKWCNMFYCCFIVWVSTIFNWNVAYPYLSHLSTCTLEEASISSKARDIASQLASIYPFFLRSTIIHCFFSSKKLIQLSRTWQCRTPNPISGEKIRYNMLIFHQTYSTNLSNDSLVSQLQPLKIPPNTISPMLSQIKLHKFKKKTLFFRKFLDSGKFPFLETHHFTTICRWPKPTLAVCLERSKLLQGAEIYAPRRQSPSRPRWNSLPFPGRDDGAEECGRMA